MPTSIFDDDIIREVELGMLRLRIARERAEELVRDRGWSEKDEDFDIQVEEETKRQWDEEYEQECRNQILFSAEEELEDMLAIEERKHEETVPFSSVFPPRVH